MATGVVGAVSKPMTSPVNWALLGLLIRRPDYGYRLTQRIERSYGELLVLGSESHVYTALDGLSRRRLIEEIGAADPGSRQPRVRYQATATAVAAYADWVRELGRRSSPLFARALTMLGGSPALAAEILDDYERECLRKATGAPLRASGEGASADRIVAEEQRTSMDARLTWIDFARGEIEGWTSEEASR